MKKIFITTIISFLLVPVMNLWSAGLTVSQLEESVSGGKITNILVDEEQLKLFPDSDIGKYAASISPSYPIKVESATVIKREGRSTLDVLNTLTDISSIKGTKYYSHGKKEDTILFKDAYTVDSYKNPVPVEDVQVSGRLPAGLEITAMLEDSRFKDNLYQFSYRVEENHISLMITNWDNLRFFGCNAIETNNFMFLLDIFLTEENIVVYNAGFCKPSVLPAFLKDRVRNAITNRMDALFGWFEGEVCKK